LRGCRRAGEHWGFGNRWAGVFLGSRLVGRKLEFGLDSFEMKMQAGRIGWFVQRVVGGFQEQLAQQVVEERRWELRRC